VEEKRRLIRRDTRLCCGIAMLRFMYLGNAFMATYYHEKGLSNFDIYGLQVVLYVASIGSGFALGRLADRRGSKTVMVYGAVINIIQTSLFMFPGSFWGFVPCLVMTGFYATAFANSAHVLVDMLVTSLLSKKAAERIYRRFLTSEASFMGVGYVVGVVCGGVLHALFGMQAPFIAQPAVAIGILVLSWLLYQPEQPGRILPKTSRTVWWRLVLGIVRHRQVSTVMWLCVFTESLALTCFWVIQPFMEGQGVPRDYFPVAYACYGMAQIVFARPVRRLFPWPRFSWTLAVALAVTGVMAAGFNSGAGAIIGIFLAVIVPRVISSRLTSDMLRTLLPEERTERNTETSIVYTVSTAASAVMGMLFGRLTDRFELQYCLAILAFVEMLVGALLLARFYRAFASSAPSTSA